MTNRATGAAVEREIRTESRWPPPGQLTHYPAQPIVMSDSNPYESPSTAVPQDSGPLPNENPPSPTDDRQIARYAQLGLRLLGVMFIVDGIAGFIGSITNGATQSSALQQAGYPPMADPYVFGWATQSIAYILIGAYCIVGGRWLLEMVFLPASRPCDIDDDDE